MPTWTAADGTLINYQLHGAAPDKETVLLLPGLLGSIESQWRPFVGPLSEQFTVALMDLRGHGRSENRANGLDMDSLLQDVTGLLNHLNVRAVHVAGYSLGGYLGLLLHLSDPRRVSSLLMHATKFYWTEKAVSQMRSRLDPDVMAEKVPTYASQLVQEHGSRWRMLVREAADLIAVLAEEGVTEGMAGRVQIPVLVSVGDRDELVSLPEALRLSRVFPNGSLLVLPKTGHPFSTIGPVPLLPTMQSFLSASANSR